MARRRLDAELPSPDLTPQEDKSPEPVPEAPMELNVSYPVASQLTVTVQWAEEAFSPKQFHTWRVGPFSATVNVAVGETVHDAAVRAMAELTKFAEAERLRKQASYLKMIQ